MEPAFFKNKNGMKTYWFVFLSDAILLTNNNEIPYSEEPPVKQEPWHHVMKLPDLNGTPCRAFRIDTPLLYDRYNFDAVQSQKDEVGIYTLAEKALRQSLERSLP